MNRGVGCGDLLSIDSLTGKNFDHRKEVIQNLLQRLAGALGVDTLRFANFFEVFSLDLIRIALPNVAVWDDTKRAARWLWNCSMRRNSAGDAE
jgi:hypothetical protein